MDAGQPRTPYKASPSRRGGSQPPFASLTGISWRLLRAAPTGASVAGFRPKKKHREFREDGDDEDGGRGVGGHEAIVTGAPSDPPIRGSIPRS